MLFLNADCGESTCFEQQSESSEHGEKFPPHVATSVTAPFADLSKLKVVCAEKNYTVVNVPSDGNCLFSALAIQLGRHAVIELAEAAREVRAEVVSYLRNHHSMVSYLVV